MGFFDKAKSFLGGKDTADVSVQSSPFCVGGGINSRSGTMTIVAKQDCTLLGTNHQIILRLDRGEQSATRLLGTSSYPSRLDSKFPGELTMPCELRAGDTVQHSWSVGGVELDDVLRRLGFTNPLDALGDPTVRVEVTCTADMKGSPFDPSATVQVELEKSAFAPR